MMFEVSRNHRCVPIFDSFVLQCCRILQCCYKNIFTRTVGVNIWACMMWRAVECLFLVHVSHVPVRCDEHKISKQEAVSSLSMLEMENILAAVSFISPVFFSSFYCCFAWFVLSCIFFVRVQLTLHKLLPLYHCYTSQICAGNYE